MMLVRVVPSDIIVFVVSNVPLLFVTTRAFVAVVTPVVSVGLPSPLHQEQQSTYHPLDIHYQCCHLDCDGSYASS